jgi:hypothetical protein
LELIKPNDQLHFSDIELFGCVEWWLWPFVGNIGFEWCPFWLTDGFFRWVTVGGMRDGGNLTGGFGLNGKIKFVYHVLLFKYQWNLSAECIALDQ